MYRLYNYVLENGSDKEVDEDDALKLSDYIPLPSPAQYFHHE